jgi:hypothetical protein
MIRCSIIVVAALVASLAAMSMASVSDVHPFTTSRHRVGPFSVGNGYSSFNIPQAPYPSDAKGIIYWGDWIVVDEQQNVVPTGKVFLHHIMLSGVVSGSSILVTGSSDERATFGPNHLEWPFVMPTQNTLVAGSVLLVGYFTSATPVWIEYTVHSYTAAQMPPNPITALSSACAITVEVPQLGIGQVFNQTARWVMPVDGYLISAVGHLHVGGIASRLIDASGEQVCNSYAEHYTSKLPCFIECPTSCVDGAATYPALKHIEPCDIYRYYKAGSIFTMDVAYDARCAFSGCHGHLYLWYAASAKLD